MAFLAVQSRARVQLTAFIKLSFSSSTKRAITAASTKIFISQCALWRRTACNEGKCHRLPWISWNIRREIPFRRNSLSWDAILKLFSPHKMQFKEMKAVLVTRAKRGACLMLIARLRRTIPQLPSDMWSHHDYDIGDLMPSAAAAAIAVAGTPACVTRRTRRNAQYKYRYLIVRRSLHRIYI